MATRSNIGYIDSNGKIRVVYCHSDGYPEHNGKVLSQNYTDPAKVKELVELGDMSFLDSSIEGTEFYGRDRGESYVDAVTYNDADEWLDEAGWIEYFYLYTPERLWEVYNSHSQEWWDVNVLLSE